MQAFVQARYEYHWAPLLGCLTGHLGYIGALQPSYAIGAATGISYQPPQDAELPARLESGLSALGVDPRTVVLSFPNRLQRIRARRRIRRELRADRPVTAWGVGVSAFGPAWGLIVGCDDERGAWRRDGPMTEQVSPWLPEAEFDVLPAWVLILARRIEEAQPERVGLAASEAFAASAERARADLLDRVTRLDGGSEIEPQRHSHEAQTLAANWGEAAIFWREAPHAQVNADFAAVSQALAVTLSRYATLFPYPMGGQPNHPGVRAAAARVLGEAVDIFSRLR